MSAVPPSFLPQTSFSTLAQQPISSTGLPGSELDGEFARAADSINQIKSRLSEVQRDDGKLRNGVVSIESLSDSVRTLLATSGARPVTWSVGGQFAVGDLVSNPPGMPGTFLCITAHTSSSAFTSDLANWVLIVAPASAGILYTNTFTGNGTTTVFTLNPEPVSKNNTQLFIDGIYQPKDGYSLSGSTLTITPAKFSAGGPSWAGVGSGNFNIQQNSIELGTAITSNVGSFIDFHSSFPLVDYDCRVIRNQGVNGVFEIHNTGAGAIKLSSSGGVTFGSANMPNPIGAAPVYGTRAFASIDIAPARSLFAAANIDSATRIDSTHTQIGFAEWMSDTAYVVSGCPQNDATLEFSTYDHQVDGFKIRHSTEAAGRRVQFMVIR